MINAKELRIGNLVFDSRTVGDRSGLPKVLHETTVIQIEERKFDNGDYNYLEPIPITSEILKKCGFAEQKGDEWYIEYQNDFFIVVKSNMQVRLGFDVSTYFEEEFDHIKYLHQLQNLFFALTGEELNYIP